MATQSRSSAASTLNNDNDAKDKNEHEKSDLNTVAVPLQADVMDPEKSSAHDGLSTADEHEYVTGIKLTLILAAVTLVYFLIMLDGSIVATV